MKKQQNNSIHAWALHVVLALALLSISAVLLAAGFKAAPARSGLSVPMNPVAAGVNDLALAGPASAQSLFPADAPFTFSNTGNLNTARDGPHGDVAAQRQGAGRGRREQQRRSRERGTVRSCQREGRVDCHRQPHHRTREAHGDVAAQRQGAGGRRIRMAAAFLAARNCTTLPAGRGAAPAPSPPPASFTRRRCCPTARCWWQGD